MHDDIAWIQISLICWNLERSKFQYNACLISLNEKKVK